MAPTFTSILTQKKKDFGLCRSIFYLMRASGKILGSTCLLQYHLPKENTDEVQFEVTTHGNRKPFYPLLKGTMEAMKNEIASSSPSVAQRNICDNAGGVFGGQLSRSRQHMYDLMHKMGKADHVDELLLYVKHNKKSVILEHHDVPEICGFRANHTCALTIPDFVLQKCSVITSVLILPLTLGSLK